MLPGVYQAAKKDGTIYYRSNITYRNKHISLGSYDTELKAHEAYCHGRSLLYSSQTIEEVIANPGALPFEKCVSLINFRDNRLYIANPIYLQKRYFSYYLSESEELKFDIDDLFYYSRHKIMRRKGHLFVNDYGMQVTILSRYGLKSYAVCNRDYMFANGDDMDWRYSNIVVINRYHGVRVIEKQGKKRYRVKIHINGEYTVGTYSTEERAAIAYNKAADMAEKAGIRKDFSQNYVDSVSASQYADIYRQVRLSDKYMDYLRKCKSQG